MIILQFKQAINASPDKVYEMMLGLKDKRTYEFWVSVFNPTSTYEGTWDKGSKINFVGIGDSGKKGGVSAEIEEHQVAQFISIRHLGKWADSTDTTPDDEIANLAGLHENYTFQRNNEGTLVIVDLETLEDYEDFFNRTFPIALEKLKELIERE